MRLHGHAGLLGFEGFSLSFREGVAESFESTFEQVREATKS
jgi:hypothetical protein